MNVYEFINSPRIRELCEKNHHRFNTCEMTIIVAHSNKPLEEKIKAYEELAYLYPDVGLCFDISEEVSVCDFLKKRLTEMKKSKETTEDLVIRWLRNHRIVAPKFIEEKDVVVPFWFDPVTAKKKTVIL